MKSVFCCALFCFSVVTSGFLLADRSTQSPTTGHGLSDRQFSLLMDNLAEERRERIRLSDELNKMKHELLSTQKGVTDIFYSAKNLNSTIKSKTLTLETKYNDLQNKYDLLQVKFQEVVVNNSLTEIHAKKLEDSIASLMQLKNINDLQTVIHVQNKTKDLEHQLQTTNNRLSAVSNDADARKQDFMALYNTEKKLEQSLQLLETDLNKSKITTETIEYNFNQTLQHLQAEIVLLNKNQNQTEKTLENEIHTMSDRVAVTAYADDKSYANSETILFTSTHMSKGISSMQKSALVSTGKFKCEKAGLYLVSAAIMSKESGTYGIVKNSSIVTYGYSSVNGNHQTSTSVILTQLNVNDVIEFKNYDNPRIIRGSRFSTITLLQLTG